jgi:hypothetical protein
MPQILYSGPRDELRWNGVAFRRGESVVIKSDKDARRLSALDGFVILPKNKVGRPRKTDEQDRR